MARRLSELKRAARISLIRIHLLVLLTGTVLLAVATSLLTTTPDIVGVLLLLGGVGLMYAGDSLRAVSDLVATGLAPTAKKQLRESTLEKQYVASRSRAVVVVFASLALAFGAVAAVIAKGDERAEGVSIVAQSPQDVRSGVVAVSVECAQCVLSGAVLLPSGEVEIADRRVAGGGYVVLEIPRRALLRLRRPTIEASVSLRIASTVSAESRNLVIDIRYGRHRAQVSN